jgi:tripartite-type tricarboxylate transporter receptor subunit TctC
MQRTLKSALVLGCITLLPYGPTIAADTAKDFPARPIRLIIPQNPGSSNDTISRVVYAKVGELLGQQFVIDNRPGAGGTIAGEITSLATPDGYTLFGTATSSAVIGPQIIKKLNYDPRGFAPISLIAITQNILVVNPKLPVKSVKDLIAYSKANPGKLNMANAGAGTQSHLAGILLAHAADLNVVSVPYRGGGASVGATIAGESQVTITPAPAVFGHVKAGRLRALATGGKKRFVLLPELPTLIESGLSNFSSQGWIAVVAPKGTPKPVLDKLRAAIVKAENDPVTSQNIERAGGDPETSTAAELNRLFDEEWNSFGAAIKLANLKAN